MTRKFMPPLRAGACHQAVFERQVEAHVRRRIDRSPYTIAPEVLALIRQEGGEADDLLDPAELEQGTPAAEAGSVSSRVLGVRDPIHVGHPIHGRMLAAGLATTMLSGPPMADWPPIPNGADEIRLAALHRWRPLVARGCHLGRLYTGDPAYDADHSSDELMQQTLDVDLQAFIDLLVRLETAAPALFRAVWLRDAPEVERLVARHHFQLPVFNGLVAIGKKEERVRTAIGVFWEIERGFEFLHAIAGAARMTHSTLGATLKSSTALTSAFIANIRDGRHLVDSWLHFLPMQELVRVGAGAHAPSSPWRAYGPGGNPAAVDHHAGLGHPAGHATLSRSNSVVAPFSRFHAHRQVHDVAPAHFIYGWDAASLAIAIPLQIASTLPDRRSQRTSRTSEFTVAHYGAFGRLGMLMLSNICPATAYAALATTADSPNSINSSGYGPLSLGYLVANFEAWLAEQHADSTRRKSGVEIGSERLGEFAFDYMARTVKAELNRLIHSRANVLGYDLGFHPPAWWSTFDPRPNLRAAAQQVPPEYVERLPACYAVRSGAVHEFCLEVAAEIGPGKTPHADDPALLYGPDPNFASGQFGGCGQSGLVIKSDALAHKADQVVAQARAGTVPYLAGPSPARLSKRLKRRANGKSTRRARPRRR